MNEQLNQMMLAMGSSDISDRLAAAEYFYCMARAELCMLLAGANAEHKTESSTRALEYLTTLALLLDEELSHLRDES
jgi:c-di-GMP-related signal transduction protein